MSVVLSFLLSSFPPTVRKSRIDAEGSDVPVYAPFAVESQCQIQGGPSGRGILFVDIKLKVPPRYKFQILKCNSFLKVNKKLSSTRCATLYFGAKKVVNRNPFPKFLGS